MPDAESKITKRCIIEGESLYLRPVRLSDVRRTYLDWINDEEVSQFLESRFVKQTMQDLQSYVRHAIEDPNTFFMAIVLKESDKHIGNIKLGPVDWNHRRGDMGILIGDKCSWGRGYATEAVRLFADYAFLRLRLHKITAGAYETNLGSIKAFIKAGFLKEGSLKKHSFYGGVYVDGVILGKINDKF